MCLNWSVCFKCFCFWDLVFSFVWQNGDFIHDLWSYLKWFCCCSSSAFCACFLFLIDLTLVLPSSCALQLECLTVQMQLACFLVPPYHWWRWTLYIGYDMHVNTMTFQHSIDFVCCEHLFVSTTRHLLIKRLAIVSSENCMHAFYT